MFGRYCYVFVCLPKENIIIMKNAKHIQVQIAKQEKLVAELKTQSEADYKNHSSNMLVSQAEYLIAKEVLVALKKVLPLIKEHLETIEYWSK